MTELLNLKENIDCIEKILLNLKKNPNRIYSAEFILNKKTIVLNLKSSFNNSLLKLADKEESLIEPYKIQFKKFYSEVDAILDTRSQDILDKSFTENLDSDEDISMSGFDISTSMRVIPEFTGDVKHLTNFLNIVEYLYDSINEAGGKLSLINFVLKTKLSDIVRHRLNSHPTPTDITQFKAVFSQIFKSKKTPLNIQSELSRTIQGNLSISDYANKIENLVAELNSLQLLSADENSRNTIIKLNDEVGLNAFKLGINDNLRSVIFAARPASLSEAISLAFEVDIPNSSNNIFKFDSNFKRQRNEKFCKYCKKKGHLISECFKMKNKDKRSIKVISDSDNKGSENNLAPDHEESGE